MKADDVELLMRDLWSAASVQEFLAPANAAKRDFYISEARDVLAEGSDNPIVLALLTIRKQGRLQQFTQADIAVVIALYLAKCDDLRRARDALKSS
jgi:hypothetical protein